VGLYKRFYPVGLTLSETGIMELNETQERLLDIVRDNPGLTQRELAERMNLSTRVINYHVGLLQRARLVSLEKAGKVTKCYATERMPVC
jgi:predicted transcriptional regulator